MATKYVCSYDDTHLFDEPTLDFWCSLCPIEKRSMLRMQEVEVVPVFYTAPEPESVPMLEPETFPMSEPEPAPIPEPEAIPDPTPEPVYVKTIRPLTFTSIGSDTWSEQNIILDDLPQENNLWLALSEKDWLDAQSDKRPVFCYPNNDQELAEQLGYLFNWYAVKVIESLMKDQWLIPSVDQVQALQKQMSKVKSNFFNTDVAQSKDIHIQHRLPMSTYADATKNRCFWTAEQSVYFTAFAFQIPLDTDGFEIRKIDKNAGFFLRVIKRS